MFSSWIYGRSLLMYLFIYPGFLCRLKNSHSRIYNYSCIKALQLIWSYIQLNEIFNIIYILKKVTNRDDIRLEDFIDILYNWFMFKRTHCKYYYWHTSWIVEKCICSRKLVDDPIKFSSWELSIYHKYLTQLLLFFKRVWIRRSYLLGVCYKIRKSLVNHNLCRIIQRCLWEKKNQKINRQFYCVIINKS